MSMGRGQAVSAAGDPREPATITILLPGPIGPVATDITDTWIRVPAGGLDLTGALVKIQAKTAPGTSDPTWDIQVSTNGGSSFTTTLPSGATNKLKLVHANKTASLTPAWAITTLNEGDFLRVDVAQTDDGTGRNVRITIEFV